MKSALVVLGLLPCLLALSLVHFVSAQTLTERVNQLLQSFVSGVDFPLQSSCPQLEDLSEQCRREFFGGVGSQAAVFCTGDCYRPVLEAYRSCSETANALTATAAGFIVHLIQAGCARDGNGGYCISKVPAITASTTACLIRTYYFRTSPCSGICSTALEFFGCCSNAYLNVGTLCGVTSEECELNAVGMSPDSGNQLEVMNGGVSAVLHSTVGIFISMIFAGLALIF